MNESKIHKHTNELIKETSPYLLQHAHNPVNWVAWNKESLEKAKQENKLLLISIGYSACHWCHVMEHESFENEEIATIMNKHFICIKVDREERPDIDQIYMNAVQLMSGQGGWPLNCFALPNGEPFYGGTYFHTNQWKHILEAVAGEFNNNPQKVIDYAAELTKGVKTSEILPKITHNNPFSIDVLDVAVNRFKQNFDHNEGGTNRAPKFPLPNNYEFLLDFYYHKKDPQLLQFINLTLTKMAYGGIYDQVGGGFARYSTDSYWKVPHFEKMLYDNAQLVSLYAKAFQATKNTLYKQVIDQTLEYIEREMTATNGAFYSALDADSEGEEGKFYTWSKEELQQILQDDFAVAEVYYSINNSSKWEGRHILLRKETSEKIAQQFNLSNEELHKKIKSINHKLLNVRNNRVRPGLDDKTLTSWNALMLKGYVDAYNTFGEKTYLQAAISNANFILKHQLRKDGGLNHNYKNNISNIDGFLEDYSFTIEAFIALYEATFDEKWLTTSKQLMDYTIAHFHDNETGFFYFTSNLAEDLIARKMELSDNVIPASNSSIAKGLFKLSLYFENNDYQNKYQQILKNIEAEIPKYVSGYSNWASLLLTQVYPFYEIAIIGNEALENRNDFFEKFIPNKLLVGTTNNSKLPLLRQKQTNGKTMIYVCYNKTCQKPVETTKEALKQLN